MATQTLVITDPDDRTIELRANFDDEQTQPLQAASTLALVYFKEATRLAELLRAMGVTTQRVLLRDANGLITSSIECDPTVMTGQR